MIRSSRIFACCARGSIAAWLMFVTALAAVAQVEITEVMHSPGGSDLLWEWVEIRNTTSAAIDLDGWVFDDDDDPHIGAPNEDGHGTPNIRAENGNTTVPAGGVAVLYSADDLDFLPQRFTDAWGGATTMIPVDGLTPLTADDAIGLWPDYASYHADAIDDATSSPRRTFGGAVTSIDYSESAGFPTAEDGRSLAWNGTGNPAHGANWQESAEDDALGAIASGQTLIASAEINSPRDRGNPGAVPTGSAPAPGLLITEIMFAPESPQVAVGYQQHDFEWVEIYNNTAAAIDFAATPHVLDDIAGGALGEANLDQGEIGVGQTGVLYHEDVITHSDMQTMWGEDVNFIPVETWPSLNNGGDTIAIWDDLDAYETEPEPGTGRTQENALAAVTYDTVAGDGWPTLLRGDSIFLQNLGQDSNEPTNWIRAGTNDESLSFHASPIHQEAVDHPGGDVGSPGFVPAVVDEGLAGDFNDDGIVDAADYTVWRDNLGAADESSLNDAGDGNNGVDAGDYALWKSQYGEVAGSSSLAAGAAVPEPAGAALLLAALPIVGARALRRRAKPARR